MPTKNPLAAQPDEVLKRLEADGDREARAILAARGVIRMIAAGIGPETYYVALDKGVRLHVNKRYGRVLMSVEINEHTTPKKIESHWKVISKFREILHKTQGPWTGGGPGFLFSTLMSLKGTPIHEWSDLLGMWPPPGTYDLVPPKPSRRTERRWRRG